MIGVALVNIELSEADALAFREYMQHRETYALLQQAGVFNTKNGKAILNFNTEGILTQIDFNVIGYKRLSTRQ